MHQADDNQLDDRQDPGTDAGPAPVGATPAVPGAATPGERHLDHERGLAMMGGNEPLYHRILASFVETYANLRLDLDQAEDRRTLHSLKGLSGNIGASRLRELAMALEKGGDAALLASFHQELSHVLDAIRALLAAAQPRSMPQRGATGEAAAGVAGAGAGAGDAAGGTAGDAAGEPTGGLTGGPTGEEASPATVRDLFAEVRRQAQAGNSRNCREALSRLGELRLTHEDQARLHGATRLLAERNYKELAKLP